MRSFYEVCEAQSAEFEQICTTFFKQDLRNNGRLNPILKKQFSEDERDMIDGGILVYIHNFELDPPCDRSATEHNVLISAEVISKFLDSYVWYPEDGTAATSSNHAAFGYESVHANKQLCFLILDNLPI